MKRQLYNRSYMHTLRNQLREKLRGRRNKPAGRELAIEPLRSSIGIPYPGRPKILQIHHELVQSTLFLKNLFDQAPVSYFILDENGIIQHVNETGIQKLEIEPEKLTGQPFSSILSDENYRDAYEQYRTYALNNERVVCIESELQNASGLSFPVYVESRVFTNDQTKTRYLLTTVSDISEQVLKDTEPYPVQAKGLQELKSAFITIVSHEFRTPLTAILSSAELMLKFNKPGHEEKQIRHFRKIASSVSRMREIMIDFLALERLEQGKTSVNRQPVQVHEFMQTILSELKSFNGIHNVHYEHHGENRDVLLDPSLLKTCISNLIINAYKYSPRGGAIEIISAQTESKAVSFSIADHGIGIPEKDQPMIFERFFRARNVSHFQGTGLGLNIAKEFVELMGGTIHFTSEEHKGSVFYVDIPAKADFSIT